MVSGAYMGRGHTTQLSPTPPNPYSFSLFFYPYTPSSILSPIYFPYIFILLYTTFLNPIGYNYPN